MRGETESYTLRLHISSSCGRPGEVGKCDTQVWALSICTCLRRARPVAGDTEKPSEAPGDARSMHRELHPQPQSPSPPGPPSAEGSQASPALSLVSPWKSSHQISLKSLSGVTQGPMFFLEGLEAPIWTGSLWMRSGQCTPAHCINLTAQPVSKSISELPTAHPMWRGQVGSQESPLDQRPTLA